MMNEKYSREYYLKYIDYIRYDKIAPHGVLDIFQDIAGIHSEKYHMSFDEMLAKDFIWVLLGVRYKVIKDIPLYAHIKATTWPLPKSLVDFNRNTIVTSVNDDLYIIGESKWIILNAKTRKIVPAKHIDYTIPTVDEVLFDTPYVRLKEFDITNKDKYVCKVEFCDIDHNGHANNARYAMMILNALNLKENEEISEFQIDYIHESFYNDELQLYYYKNDNSYFIEAKNEEKVVFLAKVKLKDN